MDVAALETEDTEADATLDVDADSTDPVELEGSDIAVVGIKLSATTVLDDAVG